MSNKFKGILSILLATLIWGSTFVAQEYGGARVGSFAFLSLRCFLGVALLLVILFIGNRKDFLKILTDKRLWKAGIPCGVALFAATALQQFGLQDSGSGKGGFITAMYILLVPIFGLFLGKKPPVMVLVAVVIATFGLYLISGAGQEPIAIGDVLLLLCAACFAVQILIMDRVAGDLNSIALNMSQALVCAILSGICMFFVKVPDMGTILDCWLPLGWAGFLSIGIAYTLQIVGQKSIEPTTASLLMSFEAVFAALAGLLAGYWGWIDQTDFSWTNITGCALLFAAILVSQIPMKRKTKEKTRQ